MNVREWTDVCMERDELRAEREVYTAANRDLHAANNEIAAKRDELRAERDDLIERHGEIAGRMVMAEGTVERVRGAAGCSAVTLNRLAASLKHEGEAGIPYTLEVMRSVERELRRACALGEGEVGALLVYVEKVSGDVLGTEGPILWADGSFKKQADADGIFNVGDLLVPGAPRCGLLLLEGFLECDPHYSEPEIEFKGEWRELTHWEMCRLRCGKSLWTTPGEGEVGGE